MFRNLLFLDASMQEAALNIRSGEQDGWCTC